MAEKMDINNDILSWARDFTSTDIKQCHKTFGQEKYDKWESGKDQPTYLELKKLGKLFRKPIAVFFFNNPPSFRSPMSNFRTLDNLNVIFSDNIVHKLENGRVMQLNLYELHEGVNPSSNLITEISFDVSSIQNTASQLRDILKINLKEQKKFSSPDDAFKRWREAFYNIGVYVFKDAFNDDSISGFCLYDPVFPVIFVNNSLAFNRQIFTLFHEIYHLIYQISGIDFLNDPEFKDLDYKKIEHGCNEFAGAFLVPDLDFLPQITENTLDYLHLFSKKYSVSREVILTKLFYNNLITLDTYINKREELYNDNFRNKGNSEKLTKGGGDYFLKIKSYKGHHYIDLVYNCYQNNKITLPQLANYLDMKVESINKLSSYLD
ncbi:MAG: ImmA/IrrE family metallo-endopeptidase [Deltaproteobacteria bacterium]|nr:ImmA/IrrE family metallo-endopeptidase [Deltaproteobacteria bacterium]